MTVPTSKKDWFSSDKSTTLNIDFIGKRRVYYAISLTLILAGIIVAIIFGVRLDISFKGGAIIQYSYTGNIDITTAQNIALKTLKATDVKPELNSVPATHTQILAFSSDKSYTATTLKALGVALSTEFKSNNIKQYAENNVDPSMGKQFFMTSIGEVLLAAALIIIYIWWRFRKIGGLPAGITAFIALVHDVTMAFVAFSLFRLQINENFIAVSLLILGYSINDTIVVFDRIRENRTLYGTKVPFRDIVNRSINQSFTRSINTTLVTFVSIAVVCVFSFIFNLESIRSFALPMMVGVVTGGYSTICIAGPLWVSWVEYKEKKKLPPPERINKLKAKNA
jgi:preprotein translocase subunit SecF